MLSLARLSHRSRAIQINGFSVRLSWGVDACAKFHEVFQSYTGPKSLVHLGKEQGWTLLGPLRANTRSRRRRYHIHR